MITNDYDAVTAQKWRREAGNDAADQELGERVYTSRLIGLNPDLVMHGGGNTSVKVERTNLFGETERILHVKGSGWDLDVIEAAGLPGVRLDPLLKFRQLDGLSDEDMVNVQRCNLLDTSSPNPSVETLLHAFLPHTYVDHTHATAFLVIANLPNAPEVCREIFGDRLGIVPYIMPGFGLAKKAAEVYEENPDVEGLLLLQHGHFAFGESAEASYNKIVKHTNEVATYFGMNELTSLGERIGAQDLSVLPMLRGVIAEQRKDLDTPMPIFDLRNNSASQSIWDRNDLNELALRGTASPDHVLRTKGKPLVLPKALWSKGRDAIAQAVQDFELEYRAYFKRQAPHSNKPKTLLTPDPKHAWIEGIGIVGMGANAKAASAAADLAEQNLRVRMICEDAGGYNPLAEQDQFELEYWSLEQAKLGKGKPPMFQGKIVMITGGASAIGLATAKVFAAGGANCILVDSDEVKLTSALAELGSWHSSFVCDLTKENAKLSAINHATHTFGGLDILVSNASSMGRDAMHKLEGVALSTALEADLLTHMIFANAAADLMKQQGRPGNILLNLSNHGANPGVNSDVSDAPNTTSPSLVRQLAVELGGDRIMVNAVLCAKDYQGDNLLKRNIQARHVGEAFVALALCERSTGQVLNVDGGRAFANPH